MIPLKGLNTKDTERSVEDGFLQESINIQWQDGAIRPIPLRNSINISNASLYSQLIAHKVSDEEQVNMLGFNNSDGFLYWIGKIIDGGAYQAITPILLETTLENQAIDLHISYNASVSFTLLNGVLYFMNPDDEEYRKLQYNDTDQAYEVSDPYNWKQLNPRPSVPVKKTINHVGVAASDVIVRCGCISYRYTFVLKTGEEVLHSPIYIAAMYGLRVASTPVAKGDPIENIHTLIELSMNYDEDVFNDNFSAINLYVSLPKYENEYKENTYLAAFVDQFGVKEARVASQEQAEQPFYLARTINNPSALPINSTTYLYIDIPDPEFILFFYDAPKVDVSTIAAAQTMPIDNNSHHYIFGDINNYNGRLNIKTPKTLLSNGYINSICTLEDSSNGKQGYELETEDGSFVKKAAEYDSKFRAYFDGTSFAFMGILSYPATKCNKIILMPYGVSTNIYKINARSNKLHNMSNSFDYDLSISDSTITGSGGLLSFESSYNYFVDYDTYETETAPIETADKNSYISENRLQFSEAGEFSVWPLLNSYRIGEGKIISVSSNNVNSTNAEVVSPLIIGATDGIHTINTDPTGNNFIASITKTANNPVISSKTVNIDGAILMVTDRGLVIVNSGNIVNITKDFFPDKGNGNLFQGDFGFPNYNLLTVFQAPSNIYMLRDINDYMKDALFAFDGIRNNIWCSNPNINHSLVYNIDSAQWTQSTFVFEEVIDFFGRVDDVYNRCLVRDNEDTVFALSSEDTSSIVPIHLMTRAIKLGVPDLFKKINRLALRCVLKGVNGSTSYDYSLGIWGKQDVNSFKEAIPLVSIRDNKYDSSTSPNVRNDILTSSQKGKYKAVYILHAAKVLPDSTIDFIDGNFTILDENKLR